MANVRSEWRRRKRRTDAERVWLPVLRPATRTFPAFVERGTGARAERRAENVRADYLVIAVLVGIVLGLAGACIYGIYYTPSDEWAFDRPEAKLAPPQPHYSPYLR